MFERAKGFFPADESFLLEVACDFSLGPSEEMYTDEITRVDDEFEELLKTMSEVVEKVKRQEEAKAAVAAEPPPTTTVVAEPTTTVVAAPPPQKRTMIAEVDEFEEPPEMEIPHDMMRALWDTLSSDEFLKIIPIDILAFCSKEQLIEASSHLFDFEETSTKKPVSTKKIMAKRKNARNNHSARKSKLRKKQKVTQFDDLDSRIVALEAAHAEFDRRLRAIELNPAARQFVPHTGSMEERLAHLEANVACRYR